MIRFFSEDIEMPAISQPLLIDWIRQVIARHGKTAGEINYIFCSDQRMIETNRTFLQHDYFTDIITFDYTVAPQLSGDIYISLETVASNAQLLGTSYQNELNRVIIHGVLHLCGFKDKTPEDASRMRELEEEALSLLN
ncbi:MAG: rRNA maturation RNase YbeY [Bacteroidota bacterium]|nr:rRNA maturation RNase YbeY [Bacteroidota bacterium]